MERLCKDCRHYDPKEWIDHMPGQCYALVGQQHPVTGDNLPPGSSVTAEMMRMTLCGWRDPKFWEPK